MLPLQTVQRQTLRHLMPNAGAVFENLFKTLEIQEPAFKEVVVLYRCGDDRHPALVAVRGP